MIAMWLLGSNWSEDVGSMNGDVVVVLVSAAFFALRAVSIWLFQEV
jgi:hypothetical protein